MILNFQQIILPDILMSLLKGDESVRNVIDSLLDVANSQDLVKLCSKLETMLRNIIFGTKVSVDIRCRSFRFLVTQCYLETTERNIQLK